MMTTHNASHERINAILELLPNERYLEIGVAKGSTFFNVDSTNKVAVDPRFRFDPKERQDKANEMFYSITSDEYFAKTTPEQNKFDLIFLDGLHTYSQTLRDFLSSIALAHEHTVWLIDDTRPSSAIAADPSLERVRNARMIQGNPEDQSWMGDVFKVIAFIDSFMPQYTCMSTEGHGQTLILPKRRKLDSPRFQTLEAISNLSYVDSLIMSNDLFKPLSFDFILTAISELFCNQ